MALVAGAGRRCTYTVCTQESTLGVSECAPLRSIWPSPPPQHARARLSTRPGTLARASCSPLPDPGLTLRPDPPT